MKVRRCPGPADGADLLTAPHALSGIQNDAVWIKMAVEREQLLAVGEGMPDNDHALIATPTQWLGIGNLAVADTIDRRSETPSAPT